MPAFSNKTIGTHKRCGGNVHQIKQTLGTKTFYYCDNCSLNSSVSKLDINNDVYLFHDVRGLIKWGNSPQFTLNNWANAISKYDFFATTPGAWENHANTIATIKNVNPKFKAGTYFQMHTAATWMASAGEGTYPKLLWDYLSLHPAGSVDGSTIPTVWYTNPVYDIFDATVRQTAANLLGNYVNTYNLNWIFLDFVSVPIGSFNGSYILDFNRNGVSLWDDTTEQDQLKQVWFDYISEIRTEVGDDVQIIPNGKLALTDDSFASIVDGCFVEDFPKYFFGSVEYDWDGAFNIEHIPSLYSLNQKRYRNGRGSVFIHNDINIDTDNWRKVRDKYPNLIICNEQKTEGLPPDPTPPM
ncbi:hypothetical protein COV24_03590 [candidate division WWE3 bacterium CG10_big_fil_rev_8_21_14_0_10_32_10]|uniref:Uncharacterized protein n=1 Tax=candidate division WWE3 bacterium CG10_big_fil_rev_8_21_14_0_10_32_10 TaxID=1975090 RepID=A0A2H0R9X3_UNCKA|nr:MAG: hypothetical protein COV24_03590 [candidate division WWE3 bacterium CG10_big_fil_rev_8_21_14_0_10_32_10]